MKNCINAGTYKELVMFKITKSLLKISTMKNNLENLEKQGNVAVCAQECSVFYPKFQDNINEYLLYLSPMMYLWIFFTCI